ncbi:MAG: DUF2207 domain-containing protein [Acidobacteriota bacterium]|nr:DUF2207 domain-containing protein [Acidobacteriota bacterium]
MNERVVSLSWKQRARLLSSYASIPKTSLICLVALLFFFDAAPANAKELRVQNFDSRIIVTRDGVIDVTEKIEVHFIGSPWHGLYRSIPIEYKTPQDLNYTLFLNIKQVTDGNGRKLKFDSSRVRHYRKLKIYIPNADDSVQTVSIEYTISDAIKYFEDHDELYWNVTGDEWDVPIESAHASILLPSEATHIRATPFTGVYGSRAKDADVEIVGNGVEAHTNSPLPYHGGLTIAVAFDKGAVHEPSALAIFGRQLRSNWPLLAPVFVFLLMFYLWWTRGRDPRLRPIAAQYEPPQGLTPGEAGTLVDNAANMRDITASIVDLAVRGYIIIEEHRKDRMLGLFHEKDYNFILQKDRAQWSTLKTHEQVLLSGIFSLGTVGETVSMDSLQNQFYKNLPDLKSGIFDSLVGQGFYAHRPDKVRSTYIGGGIAVGALMIWGGGAVAASLGMASSPFVVGGIISAVLICAFGWFMPAHTEQGTRTLEGVLGFEDFLNHVESDRFNRTMKTPQMFEKFLPFAMAFGVEKNWSKAFDGIMTQPPNWYRGGYGPNFYPMNFTSDLNAMSSRAGNVMASAPRSSGGSGFGGGGSSGGGFGGGGGGGF